jgi:hypothetical protein
MSMHVERISEIFICLMGIFICCILLSCTKHRSWCEIYAPLQKAEKVKSLKLLRFLRQRLAAPLDVA